MSDSVLSRAWARISTILPSSFYSRTFLAVTLIESTIDIVIETFVIIRTDLIHSFSNPVKSGDIAAKNPLTVYLGIFILAHVFQLYYAFDALRQKNTIQLIGLCGFNVALLAYAILQVPEILQIERDLMRNSLEGSSVTSHRHALATAVLLVTVPVVVGLCEVVFCFLTFSLFKEFGWQIYKQIGADRRLKRIYMVYQIFICLLKFDYFFLLAFTLQLVLLVPSVARAERNLTVSALPAVLVLLGLGYYGVRSELESLMCLFEFGLLSGVCYFAYKLFRIWHGRHDPHSYQNVFKSLTVFSVVCLLMTLLTGTLALVCTGNFGKGLKVAMTGSRRKSSPRSRSKAHKYSSQIHLPGFGSISSKNHGSDHSERDPPSNHKASKHELADVYGAEYGFDLEDESRFHSNAMHSPIGRMTID